MIGVAASETFPATLGMSFFGRTRKYRALHNSCAGCLLNVRLPRKLPFMASKALTRYLPIASER
jgi:hypothetical protein